MNPKVSILVATYNGEEYLHKQLDSIINQTHENLEIIIQDDGSTDNTLRILEEYAANDSRIHVSQNKSNLGIVQNFYDLISKSKGEYIAISDQDDIWEIDKIEILLNNISNYSLIYTDSELIKDDDSPWGTTLLKRLGYAPKSGRFLIDLFTENTISGHACLFKADLKNLILESQELSLHQDYMYDQLIGTIASFNDGVTYYDRPLTRHRIHESNNHNTLISPKLREVPNGHAGPNLQTLEDKQAARRKARKERHFSSFRERKRNRMRTKIRNAYSMLVRLDILLSKYCRESYDIKAIYKKKFRTCFFNKRLYNVLLSLEFNESTAKKLSRGRLYYLIFGIL
jgi:glycosyltransferase involved in cell wall biosynthesis